MRNRASLIFLLYRRVSIDLIEEIFTYFIVWGVNIVSLFLYIFYSLVVIEVSKAWRDNKISARENNEENKVIVSEKTVLLLEIWGINSQNKGEKECKGLINTKKPEEYSEVYDEFVKKGKLSPWFSCFCSFLVDKIYKQVNKLRVHIHIDR